MPLSDTDKVREICGLPPEIPDEKIDPQLVSAARELAGIIGDYERDYPFVPDADASDAKNALKRADSERKYAHCTEAECCLAMVRLLPVLNTLYTEGAAKLRREIGELDFMFHDVEGVERLQEIWRKRALSLVTVYMDEWIAI